MATYTVVWKMEDSSTIMHDTVVMDNRIDRAIQDYQNYEALMLPVMYEYAADYEKDPEERLELAKGFMPQALIISVFCHELGEIIDCADNTEELINLIEEPDEPGPNLYVVH